MQGVGGQMARQMFISGVLEQVGQGHRGVDDLFDDAVHDLPNYGIDWNGPVAEEGDNAISIPNMPCPLTEERFAQLQLEIDPLENPSSLGIELYWRLILLRTLPA